MKKTTSQSEFNKMRQEEFVSFYLARERQGSSVYYQAHSGRASSDRFFFSVMRRLVFIAGAFAAVAFFLIYAGKLFINPRAPFSAYGRVFDRVIATQNALLDFHFSRSVFSFHEAHLLAKDIHKAKAGQSPALSFFSFSRPRQESGSAKLEDVFTEAASAASSFMEPLLSLSQSLLTAKKRERVLRAPAAGILLAESLARMKSAKEKIAAALELSARAVEYAITEEDRREIFALAPRLSLADANMDRLIAPFELAAWALGVQKPRRFLLALQDVSVPRATGGFIGSYGIMETAGGLITKLIFDDVYNLDGELAVNVAPPAPLEKAATAWAFRNANWFLDFPLSAKKLAYFYAQAGGSEIDGVIALNAKAFARLLDISGPIVAPRHEGVIISAFNIGELMVARTEFAAVRKKENTAMRVLEDIVFALAGELEQFSEERVSAAAKAMEASFAEKDVMIWLADEMFQRTIKKNGWDGSVSAEREVDYLAVTVSDIGNTAPAKNAPRIFKETRISDEGDFIATIAVELEDKEGKKEDSPSRYVRAYVPNGSTLLEASGNVSGGNMPRINYAKEDFLIDDDLALAAATLRAYEQSHTELFKESGHMILGGWAPEKNARIIYTYKLPFRAPPGGRDYEMSFAFQKQPGINAFLHFLLSAPEGREIIPDAQSGMGSEFSGDFSSDKAFTLTVK